MTYLNSAHGLPSANIPQKDCADKLNIELHKKKMVGKRQTHEPLKQSNFRLFSIGLKDSNI